MAKQKSFLKLEGAVGDISFRRSSKGYKAFQKQEVNRDEVYDSKGSVKLRRSQNEFTKAAAYGALIRKAFRPLAQNLKDKTFISRLQTLLLKVIKLDSSSLDDKDINDMLGPIVTGYEFNTREKMSLSYMGEYEVVVDRANNKVIIQIPAFVHPNYLQIVRNANHFRFVAQASVLDFQNSKIDKKESFSNTFDLSQVEIPQIELEMPLSSLQEGHLFVALGLEFFYHENNFEEKSNAGTTDSLQFVHVEELA